MAQLRSCLVPRSCAPYATAQHGTFAGFAMLCIGSLTFCTFGPAWGWPAEIFHGPARASGIAIFNTFGAAGGACQVTHSNSK